jgi:hypothetical protein
MSRRSSRSFSALLLLAFAAAASGKDNPDSGSVARNSSQGFDQAVYKGLVGNVLDAIPMDPEKRIDLQRTNAVVSNTLSGRSLAVLAGLSNPILLIGGFVWGVWAASNIKPEATGVKHAVDAGGAEGSAATEQSQIALLDRSSAATGAPAEAPTVLVPGDAVSAGNSIAVGVPRPPVVKVWLPQRSGTP